MVKKIIYGVIGVLIGGLFYINLVTDVTTLPIVKTQLNEFKSEQADIDYNYDEDNEYINIFSNRSYHVSVKAMSDLRKDYLFPYGRLDPTQHWIFGHQEKAQQALDEFGNAVDEFGNELEKIGDELIEGLEGLQNREPIPESLDADIEGASGGASLALSNNLKEIEKSGINQSTLAYNTTNSKLETINIAKELNVFKEATLPIGKEGFRATSPFGDRKDPMNKKQYDLHLGYDFVNKEVGQIKGESTVPLRTVLDGKIIKKGFNNGYGNFVEVMHEGNVSTLYAHMDSTSKDLKIGDEVLKGEMLGYVGTTGNSTGPHVHFEVIKEGYKINPKPFIDMMMDN